MTTDVRNSLRGGFALPAALVFTACALILLGATFGYVSHAARETRVFIAKDRCRLAAQSAIEQAKNEIQAGFKAFVGVGTAVKVDPKQATSYNWFDKVSADRKTIGVGTKKTVTLQSPVVFGAGTSACTVYVGIGRHIEHETNDAVAELPIVATGVYTYPDGLRVTATIQERVYFATGQSEVFNYAYFVNNYGWMNGSSITINGDMRANGNVSLTGSTVNGFVYAAKNDEVGAAGTVTTSSAKIKGQSSYRSSCGNRARPDFADYATKGAYDAPKSDQTISAPRYDTKGNLTSGTAAATSGKPILNALADPIPMPFVSDLADYVEYARERKGTLYAPAYSYTDSLSATHSVAAKSVSAHYDGVGPSENAALADKGSIVLYGTQTNPIRIDGPVVVDGDVIISGYVTGQGTVYAGRNIHIVGDVKYVKAPSWAHPDANDAAVEAANADKDLLGMVAKGNIVVGNSASSGWYNSVANYINPKSSSSVVNAYACDPSDADIGYPAWFDGNYTAVETVNGAHFDKVRVGVETYTEIVKVQQEVVTTTKWGRQQKSYVWVDKEVTKTRDALQNKPDRRYYETVCDDTLLAAFGTAGLIQIDAVLYNNHGIFGTPGKANNVFNLNGSLICRDEAIIFSGNGIRFNWDMRLLPKSGNKAQDRASLPVGMQDPYTSAWQEVPDSQNPVYMAAEGGDGV